MRRLLILLPGTVWGISFIWIELILPFIGPISLTMIRAMISVVALIPAMMVTGSYFPKTLRGWVPFALLAVFNQALPFALTSWGQVYIEGGLASILLSVNPIFTVLLAWLFTNDEQLSGIKIVGIALGFLGIVYLLGPSLTGQEIGSTITLWAQLAVVASALLYAIGAVYLRKVVVSQPADLSPWGARLRVANSQFVMSTLLLLPFSLIFEDPLGIRAPLAVWGYMLLLGIGVTIFATLVYFYLIEVYGAGRASMTVYLIPVAGVLSGMLILDEPITPQKLGALALILTGVLIVNQEPWLRHKLSRQSA